MSIDNGKINEIIERHPQEPGALIAVLQDIQHEMHYLSGDAMKATSKALGVPLSKVYSVSTFYNAFSLTPRGETVIRICQGTACHIKGARLIRDQVEKQLNIKAGETTPDLKYTVEVVNCVGACAMAPVVIVNDKYIGDARYTKLKRYLGK